MTTIALICEGISEKKIITHIVQRYLGDEFSINPIQPKTIITHNTEKQNSFGGWAQVLNHCNDEKIQKAFEFNDYLIIQIDSDTCEEQNYDVTKAKPGNIQKSDEELHSGHLRTVIKGYYR
jgi:hypothetical protein